MANNRLNITLADASNVGAAVTAGLARPLPKGVDLAGLVALVTSSGFNAGTIQPILEGACVVDGDDPDDAGQFYFPVVDGDGTAVGVNGSERIGLAATELVGLQGMTHIRSTFLIVGGPPDDLSTVSFQITADFND